MCYFYIFILRRKKYGANWRHIDNFIESILFNEPPEIDDSISNEKELFDYAFKELNLDDTFSLYRFHGNYDAEGNMVGMWTIKFGRMDEYKDKVTFYYLDVDMDSGKCFEWAHYRRNLEDRGWTTAFEDTYKDGRLIIEEIKPMLGDKADDITKVYVHGSWSYDDPCRVVIRGHFIFEDESRTDYYYDCYTDEITLKDYNRQ